MVLSKLGRLFLASLLATNGVPALLGVDVDAGRQERRRDGMGQRPWAFRRSRRERDLLNRLLGHRHGHPQRRALRADELSRQCQLPDPRHAPGLPVRRRQRSVPSRNSGGGRPVRVGRGRGRRRDHRRDERRQRPARSSVVRSAGPGQGRRRGRRRGRNYGGWRQDDGGIPGPRRGGRHGEGDAGRRQSRRARRDAVRSDAHRDHLFRLRRAERRRPALRHLLPASHRADAGRRDAGGSDGHQNEHREPRHRDDGAGPGAADAAAPRPRRRGSPTVEARAPSTWKDKQAWGKLDESLRRNRWNVDAPARSR